MVYGIATSDLSWWNQFLAAAETSHCVSVFCLLSYFLGLGEALVANPSRILPRQRAINPIDTIKDKSFPLRSPYTLGYRFIDPTVLRLRDYFQKRSGHQPRKRQYLMLCIPARRWTMDESASGPLLARRLVHCVSIRKFTMRHTSRTENFWKS